MSRSRSNTTGVCLGFGLVLHCYSNGLWSSSTSITKSFGFPQPVENFRKAIGNQKWSNADTRPRTTENGLRRKKVGVRRVRASSLPVRALLWTVEGPWFGLWSSVADTCRSPPVCVGVRFLGRSSCSWAPPTIYAFTCAPAAEVPRACRVDLSHVRSGIPSRAPSSVFRSVAHVFRGSRRSMPSCAPPGRLSGAIRYLVTRPMIGLASCAGIEYTKGRQRNGMGEG